MWQLAPVMYNAATLIWKLPNTNIDIKASRFWWGGMTCLAHPQQCSSAACGYPMRAQPSSPCSPLLSRLLRELSSLRSACSQWLLLSRGVWRSCRRAVWMLKLWRCCNRDTESTCPTLRTTRSTRLLSDRSTGDIHRTWCSLSTESMRWTNDSSPGQRWVWHFSTWHETVTAVVWEKLCWPVHLQNDSNSFLIGQNSERELSDQTISVWLCEHCKLHRCVLCIVIMLSVSYCSDYLSIYSGQWFLKIPVHFHGMISNYEKTDVRFYIHFQNIMDI